MADKSNKDELTVVLANIEKSMGRKGAKSPFTRFKDREVTNIPSISFGNKAIDEASHIGGVPRGKLIEIFGPESSGKSLLSLMLIAEAQKQNLNCALLDIEQSFDPEWASSHGVDVKNLVYSNDFSSGQEALEYMVQLCHSTKFGLVVVDSTAALIPKEELEGTLDDKERPGVQAKMLSRGIRKLMGALSHGLTTCVFINQTRMKIGDMYGNPEITAGGKALPFYAHQRIRTAKKSQIKVKEGNLDVVVGQISTATFVKNKTATPFGRAEFTIVFNATSLNPVVMLANALKSQRLVTIYKGIYRIAKDVIDNSKPIDTGVADMVELADYLIENKHVLPLLDALVADTAGDPTAEPIDDAILEMKQDPTKIVSPSKASVNAESVPVSDTEVKELEDESKEDQDEPTEEAD